MYTYYEVPASYCQSSLETISQLGHVISVFSFIRIDTFHLVCVHQTNEQRFKVISPTNRVGVDKPHG